MTNEGPVVVYEQLVSEGVYRFLLKVWTNRNEFSQDIVDVYVHSYVKNPEDNQQEVENQASSNSLNQQPTQNKSNSVNINSNVIQVELDIEPKQFTEMKKELFLEKFRAYLQQESDLKLKQPKVLLVNVKKSNRYKKSVVLLELLIVEETDDSLSSSYPTIAGDKVYNTNARMIQASQNMIRSDEMVKFLRRKQKKQISVYDFLLQLVTTDEPRLIKRNYFVADANLNTFKVIDIRQSTCVGGSNSSTCKHGYCDHYTNQCVCNKYWMSNLYKYYFGEDLTSGNNCGKHFCL